MGVPTATGGVPHCQREAAASARWHEPDDARVSRAESVSSSGRNSPGRLGSGGAKAQSSLQKPLSTECRMPQPNDLSRSLAALDQHSAGLPTGRPRRVLDRPRWRRMAQARHRVIIRLPCFAGRYGALSVPVQKVYVHARVQDDAGWCGSSRHRIRPCCLLLPRRHRHPERHGFRRSQPGLPTPLSTLHLTPRGATRMTRGRCATPSP